MTSFIPLVSSDLLDRELVWLVCTKKEYTEELVDVLKERKDGWTRIVISRRRVMRFYESIDDASKDFSQRTRSNIGRFHFAIDGDVRKAFCCFLSNRDLTHFMRVEAETRWIYWYCMQMRCSDNTRHDRRIYFSNYRSWRMSIFTQQLVRNAQARF